MTNSSSVLLGGVPTNYDKTNPIVIFIVQAAIVIIFCRLLHFPLAYMRQRISSSKIVANDSARHCRSHRRNPTRSHCIWPYSRLHYDDIPYCRDAELQLGR